MLTFAEVRRLALQAETRDVLEDHYPELFEYFRDQMPYGVATATSGDPHLWIKDQLTMICSVYQAQL